MKPSSILLNSYKRLSRAEAVCHAGTGPSRSKGKHFLSQVPRHGRRGTWTGTFLKVLIGILLLSYALFSCQQPDLLSARLLLPPPTTSASKTSKPDRIISILTEEVLQKNLIGMCFF